MHERETKGNVASGRGNAQATWDEQAREVARHLEAALANGKSLPDQCSLGDLRARTRKMRAEAALARARAQARSRRTACVQTPFRQPRAQRRARRTARRVSRAVVARRAQADTGGSTDGDGPSSDGPPSRPRAASLRGLPRQGALQRRHRRQGGVLPSRDTVHGGERAPLDGSSSRGAS
jgi:hypothetical protein